MQQTGFNWQQFAPLADVVQVDIDPKELKKGHPATSHPIAADANALLLGLIEQKVGDHREWVAYCNEIKAGLPLVEEGNQTGDAYVSPFRFCTWLSGHLTTNDVIVPCSSGSAFTVTMQSFLQKSGQIVISNKGSAAMGYGLSGAIGLAVAAKGRRTILLEGDGGFSQNVQEIGTAAINKLPLKIFIFDDHGYASIRMTQSNYFGGKYVGCDIQTGLGMPNWVKLFSAWEVPAYHLQPEYQTDPEFLKLLDAPGPAAFIVPIDPLQTYFPKITSRVLPGGGMESNPLHRMTPDLDEAQYARFARYLAERQL
jgi:acetolactate synthase-1/2/3 large subunit